MKSTSILTCLALFFSVALASAQEPQAPKPAPELARLNYFSGNWTAEGDLKPSPWGPGGKFTSKDRNDWMAGKFFLLSHSSFSGAMGSGTEVAVMGYKPDDKVYTYDSYNSMGEADHSTGTVSGDTWTWIGDQKVGGQTFKGRFTMKELTPTSYSYTYETQPAGGQWSTIMEGKATKVTGEAASAGKEKKEGKKEGKEDKD
jgi:hypothetical protein